MKTKIFTAPESTIDSINYKYKIFLGGAIDMGEAEDWQKEATKLIIENDPNGEVCIFNPRRDDWDSSWKQSINDPQFNQQVNWELDCLEKSTSIIMCLTKDSKAPISLLELGLFAKSNKVVVVCGKDFYRKGNIDIVCEKYDIIQYPTLEEAIFFILK